MIPTAVLDADVLFPMVLRDTLLRTAAAGCFRLHWSARILDEVTRNLTRDLGMEADKVDALRALMEEAFPDASVTGWEELEAGMRNHSKDRHVAAAATAVGAGIIVTSNLRDFRNLPRGIVAMTPDKFLLKLLEGQPEQVLSALLLQAAGYRRPSMSVVELAGRLAAIAPRFAARVSAVVGASARRGV